MPPQTCKLRKGKKSCPLICTQNCDYQRLRGVAGDRRSLDTWYEIKVELILTLQSIVRGLQSTIIQSILHEQKEQKACFAEHGKIWHSQSSVTFLSLVLTTSSALTLSHLKVSFRKGYRSSQQQDNDLRIIFSTCLLTGASQLNDLVLLIKQIFSFTIIKLRDQKNRNVMSH